MKKQKNQQDAQTQTPEQPAAAQVKSDGGGYPGPPPAATVGDGVTDDTAAVQAALTVAEQPAGDESLEQLRREFEVEQEGIDGFDADERELPAGFVVQSPGGPEMILTEPAIVRSPGIGDEQTFVSMLVRDRRNFELCRASLGREYDPMTGALVIEPRRKQKQ